MLRDRLLRVVHHAFIILLVAGSVAVLSAQAVLDPRFVEFNASIDHSSVGQSGAPIVDRYWLSIYPAGSSVAAATVDIGKPNPDGNGIIRVDFLPLLPGVPAPNVTYEARVTAIGPGGQGDSQASNHFSFSPNCSPGISPTSRSISQTGGTGTVALTLADGCAWSAVSNVPWITLTGLTSGDGSDSIAYSVATNTAPSTRVGTLTIAGQTFSVTQAAGTCTFSIGPTGQTVAANGGTASTTVTASNATCGWTAASNNSWLTVTSGATGTGSGPASFAVAANTTTSQRNGTITIAGQTFTVTQSAGSCSFSISPASQSVAGAGGTVSTTVNASASSCSWTATSNNSWLTVTSGASGTGSGAASVSAAANPNSTQRSGTVTIAGQTFTVVQSGASCTYSISPTSQNVSSNTGTASTTVTASGSSCTWTVTSHTSWLNVIGSGTRQGTAPVAFTVSSNSGLSQRTGTATVAGRTFTVTQPGVNCSYAISPASRDVPASAGQSNTYVTTTSVCPWAGTTTASWITITTDGPGSGALVYQYAANPSSAPRSATITVANRVHTVTQAGTVGPPTAPTNFRISGGQ
jgi:hypothetical protein